jgi:hypothetical protein
MINTYEAAKAAREAGKPDIAICFRARNGHRDVTPQGWQVIRPGYKTDPDGAWYYQHNKTFTGNKGAQEALQQAKDWASAKYNLSGEWVKIPGFRGDWFPAESVPAIKAAQKESR